MKSGISFVCIDAHTCGNPVRVVTTGHPDIKGASIAEKRIHFLKEFDWIRTGLMFEPRGHDMMSGSFLFPPDQPENDASILFIETSGCLPMCGHGTIGAITIAIEKKLIIPKIPGKVRLETPAGLVNISYKMDDDKVTAVKFKNVKSFLAASDLLIDCPDLGEVSFDVAYGGNYYAIIDPQKNFKGLQEYTASELIHYSRILRERINSTYANYFVHPERADIACVSHIQWTGKPLHKTSTGRNAVFYGNKAIDRSPCGTGTSARMAQLHAKGALKIGDEFIHESYIGSTFIGRIEEEMSLAGFKAIIPSIEGWAKIYGHNIITIDISDDPYAHGFQVI